MNSRERFLETMRFGRPDRVPYFEEGIRREVLRAWRKQGLKRDMALHEMFPLDRREEIEPDIEPRPRFRRWPSSRSRLDMLRQRLNPGDRGRLPWRWTKKVRAWKDHDHPLMLRVHRGFFLSMGVDGWKRFEEVINLLINDPGFIREAMMIQGEFAAKLAESVVQDVEIDAAVFVEPIAENHGPLISPKMYEELVLSSYDPLLEILNRYHVENIIFLTFANARLLIPGILKRGFNCLWACEVNTEAMDYRDLRREFGRDLRLIGGIDRDVLRSDKEAIRREIEEKVPPLLADGGYVPLADGRVREDVPFENYVYYRRLLEKVTQA
jgi:hypothetical protein